MIANLIYYKIVTLCFDSLTTRLRSKDLKHLIPTPGSRVSMYLPNFQVGIRDTYCVCHLATLAMTILSASAGNLGKSKAISFYLAPFN